MSTDRSNLIKLLRNISKKGAYEILEYLAGNDELHYSEIQAYAYTNRILDSRSSVTLVLNWMISFGLLERRIIPNSKPVRTAYHVSKRGLDTLNKIKSIDA